MEKSLNEFDTIAERLKRAQEMINGFWIHDKEVSVFKSIQDANHKYASLLSSHREAFLRIQQGTEQLKNFSSFDADSQEVIRSLKGGTTSLSDRLPEFNKLNTSLMRSLEELKDIVHIQNPYTSIIKAIAENYSRSTSEFAVRFAKIRDRASKAPDALVKLATYGWFLPMDTDIDFILELEELIDNKQEELLNQKMINSYKKSLGEIFNELAIYHPTRKHIWNELSSLYKNKQYASANIVILANADGISNDVTKKKFFMKYGDRYLPQMEKVLSGRTYFAYNIFSAPIYAVIPINAHESDLKRFPIRLNRHEILHGADINHGTEINTLRLISFLKYLSDILRWYTEDLEEWTR